MVVDKLVWTVGCLLLGTPKPQFNPNWGWIPSSYMDLIEGQDAGLGLQTGGVWARMDTARRLATPRVPQVQKSVLGPGKAR
jgi:hypothetical protein